MWPRSGRGRGSPSPSPWVSERERAYQYLLRLVAVRPRTVEEARERLRRKGFSTEIVEAVIAQAVEENILDDLLFARLYAEDRAATRPRARRLIEEELLRKGVPREVVREAVTRALGERSDAELARAALLRRLPVLRGLPREVALRRAYAYLLRRGFTPGVARATVRELLKASGEDSEGG